MAEDKSGIIQDIQNGLSSANSKLSELNGEIADKERAYESLLAFKKQVVSTSESFNSLVSSQSSTLHGVKAMAHNNRCAAQYGNGMDRTLTSFGSKMVGLALTGFIGKINFLLAKYKAEIEAARYTLGTIQSQIENFRSQLRSLQNGEN